MESSVRAWAGSGGRGPPDAPAERGPTVYRLDDDDDESPARSPVPQGFGLEVESSAAAGAGGPAGPRVFRLDSGSEDSRRNADSSSCDVDWATPVEAVEAPLRAWELRHEQELAERRADERRRQCERQERARQDLASLQAQRAAELEVRRASRASRASRPEGPARAPSNPWELVLELTEPAGPSVSRLREVLVTLARDREVVPDAKPSEPARAVDGDRSRDAARKAGAAYQRAAAGSVSASVAERNDLISQRTAPEAARAGSTEEDSHTARHTLHRAEQAELARRHAARADSANAAQSGEVASLRVALEDAKAVGLTDVDMALARSALDQAQDAEMTQRRTAAKEALANAVESKEIASLRAALKAAEDAGIQETDMTAARSALDQATQAAELVQRRAAAKTTLARAVQSSNAASLRTALEAARAAGSTTEDMSGARSALDSVERAANMAGQAATKEQLAKAVQSGDVTLLRAALDAALAAGLTDDHLALARSTLEANEKAKIVQRQVSVIDTLAGAVQSGNVEAAIEGSLGTRVAPEAGQEHCAASAGELGSQNHVQHQEKPADGDDVRPLDSDEGAKTTNVPELASRLERQRAKEGGQEIADVGSLHKPENSVDPELAERLKRQRAKEVVFGGASPTRVLPMVPDEDGTEIL